MDIDVLYTFRRCPYAIRARWAILKCGNKVAWREVSLKQKPKEMLYISPKGTVPVLETKYGQIVDESLEIINWALKNSVKSNFSCAVSINELKEIDSLIELNDKVFKYHLDRYKYKDRYKQSNSLYHRKICSEILKDLDVRLSTTIKAGQSWLIGGKESIADWALFPFVRQFRNVDTNFFDIELGIENIKCWLFRYIYSEDFKVVMAKSSFWTPHSDEKYFPP
tara:strand:- start:755 stop:1423 length:669 start_codon:yes stop_codon:yes gene_type:complete